MNTKRIFLTALIISTALSLSFSASAQSPAVGTFDAKIIITTDCTVTAPLDLDFGSKASTSGPVTASNGGFTVTCTPGSAYTIGLKSLNAATATDGSGLMKRVGFTETIGYQLYQDASNSTVWGDDAGAANHRSASGTGAAQLYTVYGKTTSTLNVPVGTYKDTVNISVYY